MRRWILLFGFWISYGPACDGNQKPSGADTSGDARPLKGSVPYGGVGIYNCVNDGDVAITYDDGPYIYTAAMLDAFKAHGAVATWFITGNNIGKGMINVAYSDVIQRMVADGHQIASHTWSHENLDQMTQEQRKNQMVYNEIAFQSILGFYPTYMRPPYSICGQDCQAQMLELGYHITYFDLDTQGYLHTDPSQIAFSVGLWDQAMQARSPCNGSYLHIEHDIHQQIATTLTNHILDSVVANGWNAVTVGTCLGDPPENWYRGNVPSYNFKITPVSAPVCSSTATSNSLLNLTGSAVLTGTSATSTSIALAISLDAACGSVSGQTCQGSTFGDCCSQYGYCGKTEFHCGAGCQSGFGKCTTSDSSSSTAVNSGTVSALLVSLTGSCGANNGNATCAGSIFGNCCSQYGYCGSDIDFCGTGCQSDFGSCGEWSLRILPLRSDFCFFVDLAANRDNRSIFWIHVYFVFCIHVYFILCYNVSVVFCDYNHIYFIIQHHVQFVFENHIYFIQYHIYFIIQHHVQFVFENHIYFIIQHHVQFVFKNHVYFIIQHHVQFVFKNHVYFIQYYIYIIIKHHF
ncbi:chitin binding protein [Colletotrichum tofieldiae]|nr:chitin binding protein [Colletotrichum tofieldiae]GKT70161.1 chitin binding protein [Colletotrichum tofieldiae]